MPHTVVFFTMLTVTSPELTYLVTLKFYLLTGLFFVSEFLFGFWLFVLDSAC